MKLIVKNVHKFSCQIALIKILFAVLDRAAYGEIAENVLPMC
jgi:hypothetical protein